MGAYGVGSVRRTGLPSWRGRELLTSYQTVLKRTVLRPLQYRHKL